jgi:hypothetical protein
MMEFVNEVGIAPYMKWKIKFMFQTTNQWFIVMFSFSQCALDGRVYLSDTAMNQRCAV